jgi:hypothetical protein
MMTGVLFLKPSIWKAPCGAPTMVAPPPASACSTVSLEGPAMVNMAVAPEMSDTCAGRGGGGEQARGRSCDGRLSLLPA